jgi:hypothetical protein
MAVRSDKGLYDILMSSNEETIGDNPLYEYAVSQGDVMLARRLRLYYRIATDEECGWLSEKLGYRILPSLPAEYDNDYYVDSDGIDYELLLISGYRILHTPYFSMKGSTHSVWTLNPHAKTGVDAAKCGSDTITFSEYMSFFESSSDRSLITQNMSSEHSVCDKI